MAIFRSSSDTFFVEEIPAYVPCGDGDHTYVWIEKRNLTTMEAVSRLARMLGVDSRDVGFAGMKDRHATTRQWLSLPAVDVDRAGSVNENDLRVLAASRHRNKLRTGHLRGNRFRVRLENVSPDEQMILSSRLAELARVGVPNLFGHQRFGSSGDNLQVGLAVLRRERREPDSRRRKLLLSAVQSAVFNRVLQLRMADGLTVVRTGDILERVESGGQFATTDIVTDQARVDAGEIVPTAPLPGSRVREPELHTEARRLEDKALEELGIAADELAQVGRALPGSRRPVVVKITLEDPAVVAEEGLLELRFALPAGSYATVVLDALGVDQPRTGRAVLASDQETPSA